MKRLRDVAVRMRPRTSRISGAPGTVDSDAPAANGGALAAAAPTAHAGPAAAMTAEASTGFAARNEGAAIPARTPFMPASRDLARNTSEMPVSSGPAPGGDPKEGSAKMTDDTPARPAPDRPISQRRRAIWDLDDDGDGRPDAPAVSRPLPGAAQETAAPAARPDRPDMPDLAAIAARAAEPDPVSDSGDDMASRARRALAAAERQMAERGIVPPTSGAAPGAGDAAKTRVLGFHATGLQTDAISAVAQKARSEVRFPAGWIVVTDGPGRGAYFAVTNSVSSIGRGEDQSISLNFGDATISRQNHAAIAYDAEQNRFFLGHGSKSNIVRRNGQPVLSTEELNDGDVIRIGKTSLRFVALCGPDFTWGDADADDAAEGDA